ncbi:hypothetical protein JTB14_028988 [Gonioctena quinquepunctata]|nr:hypothetical protein JTB14_028988 [Gonioctena quinquepunctata]
MSVNLDSEDYQVIYLLQFIMHSNTSDELTLNIILYRYKSKCNIAALPPTREATKQHSFRTYHQVQAWKTGLKCSVICTCCQEDACENSADIFAGCGEEGGVDEHEDLTVAKLLAHEVEEDNKDENSEEEERHLQEDIDISEPGLPGYQNRGKDIVMRK